MFGILLVSLIISGFLFGKVAHIFIRDGYLITFLKIISLCQNISIFLLLLMMGFKIGSNQELVADFKTIGLHSVLFGVSTLLGSALVTWLFISIANKIHLKNRNKKLKSHVPFSVEENPPSQLHNIIMIGVFLGLVVLGGFIGYFGVIAIQSAKLAKIVDGSLMALVFFIGVDMGMSQLSLEHLKSIGKSVALICLGVIFGSITGAIVIGFILDYDLLFSIAIGAPMGWYSLAGIMLSKINEEMGAIAFSANLIRELIAMATVPIIGVVMSKESAIATCGATAMDTTLPAITRGLGKQYAVTGFACGIIISAFVALFLPILQTIYGII